MATEEKKTMDQAPVEGKAKEIVKEEKAKKEKLLVKAGKGLKKVLTSKPMKIAGRALLVAGSTLGTVAFLKSGTGKNYENLDMLDITPQFPDTQTVEIPTKTETADETE